MTRDLLGERLSRELTRLADRIEPSPPPPLELVERRVVTQPLERPRRWGVALVATGAVAALVAGAVILTVPRPSPIATVGSAAAPVAHEGPVTVAAVPFVLSSREGILDANGSLLAPEIPMSYPRWSDDGRWIAFQTEPAGDIRVVAADGSADQAVWHGDINAFAWSETGPPVLAVLPRAGGLATVDTAGRVHWVVARGVPVISMTWRGADLSWALAVPRGLIGVLTASGRRSAITGAPVADLLFAHWVGPDHLLAWLGGPGRDEVNGLELDDLVVAGDRVVAVHALTTSLVAPGWVVPGPAGTAADGSVLVVSGEGAIPWRGKAVLRCAVADDTCTPLVADTEGVTLDPAWSPDGRSVAYVSAAAWAPGGAGNVNDWFPTRRLWVVGADGARAVEGAGAGVTAPSWSADGTWIRYSTGDAVVAVPAAGGNAVTLASGLVGGGAGAGPDGYGKGPWTALAAWSPAA